MFNENAFVWKNYKKKNQKLNFDISNVHLSNFLTKRNNLIYVQKYFVLFHSFV